MRETPVTTRFSEQEAAQVEEQRRARGFADRSSYIRHLVRQDGQRLKREKGRDA